MIRRILQKIRSKTQTQLEIEHGGATHIGDKKMNSDRIKVNREKSLFLVADGAGEESGQRAARFATMVVSKKFDPRKKATLLRAALEAHQTLANAKPRTLTSKQRRGLTMLSALHINKKQAHVVHAGDSSIFILRNNRLVRITPEQNPILHGIGSILSEKITPFATRFAVRKGDVFLLCTDGLTGSEKTATGLYIDRRVLRNDEIEKTLQKVAKQKSTPEQAAGELLAKALRRGSHRDNVTALVVKVR